MKENSMMSTHLHANGQSPKAESTRRAGDRLPCRRRRRHLFLAFCYLLLFLVTPGAWTQYPYPFPPPPPPQPGSLAGPTLGASLRNAAASTQTQADTVRKLAADWGRRAGWANYRVENFQQDYANMQYQFATLRNQFNWLGNLALQLGRPRANNAVTELESGLNIIAELFTFLESQFNAGTLDQKTIVRTCSAFEDAIREWQKELRKNSSRMGLAW
jgi:hypothetical protein